ncbi:ribonucleotide reductase of class Ia (aerobic), alpha subunit [Vibrio phage JSF12]|uniref:Ribonucleoside-diphosphate reductase n=2 Tax=Jesfedecavirus TaxID=2560156 RepID=A0A2D0Z3T0_9CAUD|nr:ribonucleotide reductase [Vibrio phage JSF10]YP_009794690.1 ribonucleotide reductase [Vibrio phage JSF12]ASV43421.1 ribonucleotide reductase of class Ia (aerobic), alpha subunit [Vibrio phage JSF10]ASV43525.1 ribonucleotide reductase of class Ia (aerobic), alpha subunit [Vibrio phage JSF12]
MHKNIFEQLEFDRLKGQKEGTVPEWMTTEGYQLLTQKYMDKGQTVLNRYQVIAKTAASHMPDPSYWEPKFFELFWKGWLAASTPVMANMGTDKGLPVSCSGGYIDDSIDGFYSTLHETAMLTKNGFGTSAYLGDIRPRGAPIRIGGQAAGVMPVIADYVQCMRDVAQGNTRRGAWAGYLPLSHGDFDEVVTYLKNTPDDLNLGWNVYDKDVAALDSGDPELGRRFSKALHTKLITGKGYFFFPDKVNRANPPMYKDRGLTVKGSNLCTEINLFSDHTHTFTCVLSSMNGAKYDEWKDTDAVFTATVFLDCVAQDFIIRAKEIPGLSKAVRFTEASRALGLGLLGYHTYLQDNMIAFESFEAHMKNLEIFEHLNKESLRASEWMAKELGEPEWCKGYGVRNTHRLAIAPNTSSSLLCGGVSQGIEPLPGNCYIQPSAAGELVRLNSSFIKFCERKGVPVDRKLINSINDKLGSVQHLDWMSDEEKLVFKTAYEIDQMAILRKAAARQPRICQGQSLNLFFRAEEDEAVIAKVFQAAFKDENIKQIYYLRTMAGLQASKEVGCIACE